MPSVISESMYQDRTAWFYYFQAICFIVFSLFLNSCFKVSQGNDEKLFPISHNNFKNVFSICSSIPYLPCNIQFCLCWPGTSLDIYWKTACRERHKTRLWPWSSDSKIIISFTEEKPLSLFLTLIHPLDSPFIYLFSVLLFFFFFFPDHQFGRHSLYRGKEYQF